MAEAIISGMKKAELDANITVSEPIPERASYLAKTYDVGIAENNVAAVCNADLAVLSVKPQQLGDVADEISGVVTDLHNLTFMSIMAGVQSKTIIEQIGCDRLIRIMANTPSQVGLGATAWTTSPTVSDEMRDFAAKMLASFGEQVYFDDEKLVDIATALSASWSRIRLRLHRSPHRRRRPTRNDKLRRPIPSHPNGLRKCRTRQRDRQTPRRTSQHGHFTRRNNRRRP